ncbi:MAG: hypothetical protein Q9219_000738 [cf. Caloplaca sp. 3 TL-2023]
MLRTLARFHLPQVPYRIPKLSTAAQPLPRVDVIEDKTIFTSKYFSYTLDGTDVESCGLEPYLEINGNARDGINDLNELIRLVDKCAKTGFPGSKDAESHREMRKVWQEELEKMRRKLLVLEEDLSDMRALQFRWANPRP